MDNLKTKVDDLGVDELEIVPVDLEKVSDAMSEEVIKKQNSTN